MLLMALVYYQERAFFMDAGFQLFNMINEGCIQIYHYRFVTALPQILPYILMKMGAPLWALGMAFSASYILFFLLIYHLLVSCLKNDFLGWVLIFLFTLITFDAFYHMQSEFYLGLALLLLSFGVILRFPEMKNKWVFPVLFPLLVTVGFSHKLSLVFFLFLWIFFWLHKQELRHRRYILMLIVFLFIAAIKSIYFTNWYEAAKQVEFQNNLKQYFPGLHTLPSNLVFLKRCVYYYYMLPVLLFAVSAFYILKKQWWKLFFVWSFFMGFILLYNISDPQAQYRFYSEVTYLPLTIFVSVPFLFDMVPYFEKRIKWMPALFIGLMVLRLSTIAYNHKTFARNFDWIKNQLQQSKTLQTNRFLIKKENAPMDIIMMEWGVPFTAMHLSALDNPKEAKTLLIMPDFNWYKNKMEDRDLFFSPFHKTLKKAEINSRYYDMESGKYKEIK